MKLWMLCGLVLVACSKKEKEIPLAPAASALEVSKATSMAVHFEVQKDGKTTIDLIGPKKIEHIKAVTSASDGSLDVDLMDVSKSVGEVKVDLTTMTMHTFDDQEKNDTQTGHALNWMEIGSDYPTETREKYKWAIFAIRSIDNASASDVSKVAATKEGSEDVRTITFTAHGEMLVHEHKANKDLSMEARFYWPSNADAQKTKPDHIVFATKSPLKITLKEHDVRPRDTSGKLLQWSTELITKVADDADVTFELSAKPTG